jgi:hypothetical protein
MKIRMGFVSNSSSASFVVKLADITDEQLVGLMQATYAYGTQQYKGDSWDINIVGDELHGSTSMDNGDLREWMDKLEIDASKFIWEDWS